VSSVVKKVLGKTTLIGKALGLGEDDRPPTPEAPKVAPDPDAEEAARAKSRSEQRRRRTGRTSTVLTAGTKLG